MKFKIVRHYVSPHKNRFGQVTRNGWDVRKVVIGEDGIEREGGLAGMFANKRTAKAFCQERNSEHEYQSEFAGAGLRDNNGRSFEEE